MRVVANPVTLVLAMTMSSSSVSGAFTRCQGRGALPALRSCCHRDYCTTSLKPSLPEKKAIRILSSSLKRFSSVDDSNEKDSANNNPSPVSSLLSQALSRAQSIMTSNQDPVDGTESSDLNDLLQATIKRSSTTLETSASTANKYKQQPGVGTRATYSTVTETKQDNSKANFDSKQSQQEPVHLNYGNNPTIALTALAHSLWDAILRPGVDSAIDATAGNGVDSLAIAKKLFTEPSAQKDNFVQSNNQNNQQDRQPLLSLSKLQSELVCVDIQQHACDKTRERLQRFFQHYDNVNHDEADSVSQKLLENHVHICCGSHESLPLPTKSSSPIALVVYNLGFLPSSTKPETAPATVTTQTDSTIASLATACQILRVGGMLSIMTYPKTNRSEDAAVHVFVEGLALFSSLTQDWKTFVLNHPDPNLTQESRQYIYDALDRVWKHGGSSKKNQTWRVHEHRKLGWIDAPILLTATRIK